jgi:hypothetical protein
MSQIPKISHFIISVRHTNDERKWWSVRSLVFDSSIKYEVIFGDISNMRHIRGYRWVKYQRSHTSSFPFVIQIPYQFSVPKVRREISAHFRHRKLVRDLYDERKWWSVRSLVFDSSIKYEVTKDLTLHHFRSSYKSLTNFLCRKCAEKCMHCATDTTPFKRDIRHR